jgi:electron transfer flavoprotein alpha subunit
MVFVVVERTDDGIGRASLEAIAAARQIGPASAVLLGRDVGGAAGALARAGYGLTRVIALEHDALESYTAEAYVQALAGLVATESPSYLVFAHTYQARDYVPRLAARLNRPLAADCTALRTAPDGVVFTRPMFQGKAAADVVLEGPSPHLVTVQVGAFRLDAGGATAPPPVRRVAAAIDTSAIRVRSEPPLREARQAVDLGQADRIVAVGRGIRSHEHLVLIEQLATALGAEVAASRPICDAGWMPMSRQVGSSGQTVSPRLYLALGISGAIQHVVGMRGARTIIAVNKDPDAPIFEIADYGIVGDLFDVVPAMIAALQQGGSSPARYS